MMRTEQWKTIVAASVVVGFLCGCGGAVSSPTGLDGSKITLFLCFEDGIKENMKDPQKEDQARLVAWMAGEVDRLFREGGYLTQKVQAPKDFKPAPGMHLVVFTLDSYRSEDVYTQIETRLGTGVTHIRATIELFKDNHTLPVARHTESVASSRDWTVGAGELSEKSAVAVSARINELY